MLTKMRPSTPTSEHLVARCDERNQEYVSATKTATQPAADSSHWNPDLWMELEFEPASNRLKIAWFSRKSTDAFLCDVPLVYQRQWHRGSVRKVVLTQNGGVNGMQNQHRDLDAMDQATVYDINNLGQLVGQGSLQGVDRGRCVRLCSVDVTERSSAAADCA